MVGLWLNKRWAEYLTFIATTALVPYEIYELTNGVSVFKLIALGDQPGRGDVPAAGQAALRATRWPPAEHARREYTSGWGAIERATPGQPGDGGYAGAITLRARCSSGRLA